MSESVKVITFVDAANEKVKSFQKKVSSHNLDLIICEPNNASQSTISRIKCLYNQLKQINGNPLCLIANTVNISLNGSQEQIISKFDTFKSDIVFSAASDFKLKPEKLFYFYWKHYPRISKYYYYLNSNLFIGKKEKLIEFIDSVVNEYKIDLNDLENTSDMLDFHSLFTRYYVDQYHGAIRNDISLSLDHNHLLLGSTGGRTSTTKFPSFSWMFDFLFFNNEKTLLQKLNLSSLQIVSKDYSIKDNKYFNKKTSTSPEIIDIPDDNNKSSIKEFLLFLPSVILSCIAFVFTNIQMLYIRKLNKGELGVDKIFRFKKNTAPDISQGTERLVSLLEKGVAFSFAHYNIGELLFVQYFLAGETHNDWHGRKQQRYDPKLGERLYEAIQVKKENYFIGIPCSTCHPEQRKQAEETIGKNDFKIPAMIFHHNLSYVPRILFALKKRQVFYFTNPYQDLSFFSTFGLEVKEENIVKVPFKNSYLHYDDYKDMIFPEGSVVLLTCGMLAKILIKEWTKKMDNVTFLALGSALDDLIQRNNINFHPFPKTTPLTLNRTKSGKRPFLFGPKKECNECYTLA